MSDSLYDLARAVPTAHKALAAVVGFAVTIGVASVTAYAWVGKHPTRVEMATADKELADVAAKHAAELAALRKLADDSEARDRVAFELLVSARAAELEPDRRKRFDASREAVKAYRADVDRGVSIWEAARRQLEVRPPR